MPARKGLLAPQNTFLDTIATRFDGTHSNFVLGNAKITRIYPIVYCSDGFCELTGYSRAQIMQKSCACNFLYGQKTDVQHRDSIAKSLERKQELKLEVILYKSSGTPFWCLLDIVPIQDEKHEVVLFLCSHKDITKQKLHEQQQRIALHHQMHLQQAASADQQLAQQQQQQHQNQHTLAQDTNNTKTQHNSGTNNNNNNNFNDHPICMANASELHDKRNRKPDEHDPERAGELSPSSQSQQDQQRLRDESKELDSSSQLQQQQQQQMTLQQQQEHDDQQALISMEEFCIDDMDDDDNELDGDQDDEHHDKHTANQYSRRRSRAVLYQLSGHYGYRRSVNMKTKLKLNNRMTIPEYKTTTIEKQKFILSHYGLGKSCWDWLILVVSFYVAIVVPYNATFKESRSRVFEGNHHFGGHKNQSTSSGEHEQRDGGGGGGAHFGSASSYSSKKLYDDQVCEIDSIDIFVEVVFIIDVILNFRTTFVNRKGEVVTRPKIICRHYFRGWFVVDACAAMPFDLLCGLNLLSRSLSNIDLNLLKLIRLLRLARLLQKMDRYSQYSYIILTLLMLIFSLLAHWCACIWYVIAMEEIGRHPPEWKLGWIHQLSDKLGYNVVNVTDMASSYVTALYFTTSSLTSVGFGNVSANTNAEKIFSIVIMLIGALMHAVVFGNVTALIRVMYARRSNYQTRLRDLKDFFRLHQLPKELQQRMIDYFQTTWSLNHGIDTAEILKDFPGELCGDVSLHLHREVLSLPIFENAPQGFLKSLARHIESKFCCPTEYLIHRGDALGYLYLVCNGSMEVLQDNMVVGILGKGDLVGYDVNATLSSDQQQTSGAGGPNNSGGMQHGAMTAGSGNQVNKIGQSMSPLVKSSSDLKALTYCDLKCIHIGGLLEVLKLYPEFADTFHDEIIHDLSFNLREQHEEHDLIEAPAGDEDEDDDEDEERDDDDDDDDGGGGGGGDDDGQEDDDEDDDDDDEDKGQGDRGGEADANQQDDEGANEPDGGISSPRSPPPPPPSQALRSPPAEGAPNEHQMGRLLRSITENGSQNKAEGHIGRYVYNDDDDVEMADAAAAAEASNEQDDDEVEPEDEEEFGDSSQVRPDLGGGERQESSDDSGSQLALVSGAGNRANSGELRTGRRKTKNAGGGDVSTGGGGGGFNGRQNRVREQTIESASLDGANNGQQLDQGDVTSPINDSSQSLVKRFGPGNLGARLARKVRNNGDDWDHFSHSYDGLVGSPGQNQMGERANDGQGPNQQRQQRTATRELTKLRNRSDEIVLELAQLHRTSSVMQTTGGGSNSNNKNNGNSSNANPQRLKSAIGVQGQARANKPPISFDLSRNTTAIINRRRRSAGYIQKINLISATTNNNAGRPIAGRVSSGDRSIGEIKQCQSSSLININENEPMTMRQQMARNGQAAIQMEAGGQLVGGRRRSLERSSLIQQQQQSSKHQQPAGGGKTTSETMKASYSNQDLQQIDAHITASVRKLRQEFRQEINRAIESLARMVLERDSAVGLTAPNLSMQPLGSQQQLSKRPGRQGQSFESIRPNPMQRRGPNSIAGQQQQQQQLQRRCTELAMARREEPHEVAVVRSISSNSFNGGPTQTNRSDASAKFAASEQAELQYRGRSIANQENNFQHSPSQTMVMMDGKGTGSSLVLAPVDSCPVGLMQQQSNGQEQRPASDSGQQQQRQSSLMLNASDNDSGRSTCSVNSSAAAFASSSRSPISTAQTTLDTPSQLASSEANCSQFNHKSGAQRGATKTMLATNELSKRPKLADEFTNCTSRTINVCKQTNPSERSTEL